MTNEAGNWYNFNVTGQGNNITYLFVYANDTSGNLNRSLERFINISTPIGDTCDTCTIDCTENCVVDSNLDCEGGELTFKGAGTIGIQANITNYNKVLTDDSGCGIICDGGCMI